MLIDLLKELGYDNYFENYIKILLLIYHIMKHF